MVNWLALVWPDKSCELHRWLPAWAGEVPSPLTLWFQTVQYLNSVSQCYYFTCRPWCSNYTNYFLDYGLLYIFFLFGLLELSAQATLGLNSHSWKLNERRRKRLVLQLTTKITNTNCEILYNTNCEVKVLCELHLYLGISV
jgi:hypothetical protein